MVKEKILIFSTQVMKINFLAKNTYQNVMRREYDVTEVVTLTPPSPIVR